MGLGNIRMLEKNCFWGIFIIFLCSLERNGWELYFIVNCWYPGTILWGWEIFKCTKNFFFTRNKSFSSWLLSEVLNFFKCQLLISRNHFIGLGNIWMIEKICFWGIFILFSCSLERNDWELYFIVNFWYRGTILWGWELFECLKKFLLRNFYIIFVFSSKEWLVTVFHCQLSISWNQSFLKISYGVEKYSNACKISFLKKFL